MPMKGVPHQCQIRLNPNSGLGRSISSWLGGYWEHPQWCKAHSSIQESLSEENHDDHEEPEAGKLPKLWHQQGKEWPGLLKPCPGGADPPMCPPALQGHRHPEPCPLEALLLPPLSGPFCAKRRAHVRVEAWPLFFVSSWRMLFLSMMHRQSHVPCLTSVAGCSGWMVKYP